MNHKELLKFEEKGYTLIFDLDNTIYCENSYLKACFRTISNLYTNNNDVYYFLIKTFYLQGRKNLFDKCIDNFGNANLDDPVSHFLHIYRSTKVELRPYDWFLLYLNDSDYPSCNIITNGNVDQQRMKVKNLGLKNYKPTNIVYSNLYEPKPSPVSINYLNIDIDSKKTIYIGDSYVDYQFSKNSGVNFIHTENLLTHIN